MRFEVNLIIQWSGGVFQQRFISFVLQRWKLKLTFRVLPFTLQIRHERIDSLLSAAIDLLVGPVETQKAEWKEKSKGLASVSTRDWLQGHTDKISGGPF